MRYISYYAEYPIHEPAEGGYYYAGNQLLKTHKKLKRQCRKDFEEIWNDCLMENRENGFTKENEADWAELSHNTGNYPWIRVNASYIYRDGRYIGQGESYVIEKKAGSNESGRVPYC